MRWKKQIKFAAKFTVVFYAGLGLILVIGTGLRQTRIEDEYPTPRDWSFWSRWDLRQAHYLADDEDAKFSNVITDWGGLGYYCKELLARLEDEDIDGQNILKGETLVAGIGRTGFDVSMKSAQWRRGYYQALMGAATAAEHLEGMVRLKEEKDKDGRLYPRDSIPGPNNPRPKPLPWDRKGRHKNPPNEDQVVDASEQPEVYYMRILTTTGFDNGQKVDAALAFAEWCDYKGLHDTARNMYDWALDIGIAGLPEDAGQVIDKNTGAINEGKDSFVSRNLLRTTTALGVHHARTGNLKDGLAVFLSVLRTRKTLPPEPPKSAPTTPRVDMDLKAEFWAYIDGLKNYLLDTPYPAIPLSGDERPTHSLKEACEEVGLMTYIGEILFASNDKERTKGLSWTRDSVEAAEAVLWVMDEQRRTEGRERCKECLETGLTNWRDMTAQMSRIALRKKEDAQQYQGFLGTGYGREAALQRAEREISRWKEEEEQIELRKEKTSPLTRR